MASTMNMSPIIFTFMVFSICCVQVVYSVNCYTCLYDGTDPTKECIQEPWNYTWSPEADCPIGHCFTEVQTIVLTNTIHLVRRRCQADGDTEGCSDDGAMNTCTAICDTDYCNVDIPGGLPTTTLTPPPSRPTIKPTPTPRQCYSCVYTINISPDENCIRFPAAVPSGVVACSSDKECNVFREELINGDGLRTFRRGCDPKGFYDNECEVSYEFNTCTTTCSGHLCNNGDGIPSSNGNNGMIPNVMILLFVNLLGMAMINA